MEISLAPNYTIDFHDKILRVEFSPYERSQNMLCIAFINKITVATVRFKEEKLEDQLEFDTLQQFDHEIQVRAVAWSPATSLAVVPKCVAFATAGADYNLRLYTSDLATHTLKVLTGHSNYVNAITYQPEGHFLASVSDDFTCKIWDVKEDNHCMTTFFLTSPGMAVCCHREFSGKLLVGEKSGILRLYNVLSQQALMSFDNDNFPLMTADLCGQQALMSFDSDHFPLMAADWCPGNRLRVAAVSGGYLFVWNLTNTSQPIAVRMCHMHGGQLLRFSPLNENLIATVGQPNLQLKITNLFCLPTLTSSLQFLGGLTWHFRLPYVCAGSDTKLLFWKI